MSGGCLPDLTLGRLVDQAAPGSDHEVFLLDLFVPAELSMQH